MIFFLCILKNISKYVVINDFGSYKIFYCIIMEIIMYIEEVYKDLNNFWY